MKIFANSADEIADTTPEPTSGNFRYPDNSSHFPAGFGYDTQLNSATLNGILHKLTGKLEEMLHCNSAKIPGLVTNRTSRYNTLSEIQNPQYQDSVNYVKKDYFNQFVSSRFKLLKKDSVNDYFSNSARADAYLSLTEGKRSKGLFLGTNLPPKIFNGQYSVTIPTLASQGISALKNTAHLFNINSTKTWYAKVVIPHLNPDELCIFEVRNTLDSVHKGGVIAYVQLTDNLSFRGVTIPNNALYKCKGRGVLIIKGTVALALYGLENLPPSLNLSLKEKLMKV